MITRIGRIVIWCRNAALGAAFSGRGHRGLGDRGFTLIEMAFACEVMMLLTLISFSETRRVQEHAKTAACMRYQAIIARSMWAEFALTGEFPADNVAILNGLPRGALDQVYDYKTIGLLRGDYYMRCGHNHSYVGVLFVDSGAYFTPKAIYALAAARGSIP